MELLEYQTEVEELIYDNYQVWWILLKHI